MRILALDTSTDIGSVAVLEDELLLAETAICKKRAQLVWLIPAIEQMLAGLSLRPSDMDGIAVGEGPGFFTGIRLAVSTAKTLAQVLGIPVIGIGTLDAMAFNAVAHRGTLCPFLDARRNEVFSALYRSDSHRILRLSELKTFAPAELVRKINETKEPVVMLGIGTPHDDQIKKALTVPFTWVPPVLSVPRAAAIGHLARLSIHGYQPEDFCRLQPVYLRKSEAERNWEQKEAGRPGLRRSTG
ncbi:MAG: tRNA (adenosine(37)-N6)-threonylcarbamoyltransferase complex dimerization subunit type 1 TsaB [Armatimonadetes bacterium]|nr:tRNA (adenosine(37)-N6)-threonylcarbamoyltransferase complex dimerization subunit type 1 TsaB [Armatimonadota bacterium]